MYIRVCIARQLHIVCMFSLPHMQLVHYLHAWKLRSVFLLHTELKTAIREFEAKFVAKYGHKVRTCTYHKQCRDKCRP